MNLWSLGLAGLCGKLKSLYFYYHIAYGYHIWHDLPYLPWGALISLPDPQWAGLVSSCDKLNKSYIHLQKTHKYQTEWKLMTYRDRQPPLKPHDSMIMWSTWGYVTVWKIHIFSFTRLITTKHRNYWVIGGGSIRKCLFFHLTWCEILPTS